MFQQTNRGYFHIHLCGLKVVSVIKGHYQASSLAFSFLLCNKIADGANLFSLSVVQFP